MSELDWSTPQGLEAITQYLTQRLPGWQPPIVHAVAMSPASSSPEWEFLHIDGPRQRHTLPAVILATILGHDGASATLEVSKSDLREAVATLEPAQACQELDHPNLTAWRLVLAEMESNPMRTMCAVFVRDLTDPVTSEADGCLRLLLERRACTSDAPVD